MSMMMGLVEAEVMVRRNSLFLRSVIQNEELNFWEHSYRGQYVLVGVLRGGVQISRTVKLVVEGPCYRAAVTIWVSVSDTEPFVLYVGVISVKQSREYRRCFVEFEA